MLVAVHRLFTEVASLGAQALEGHGVQQLRCADSRAQARSGLAALWHKGPFWTGIEPVCPALADGFLPTEPPDASTSVLMVLSLS